MFFPKNRGRELLSWPKAGAGGAPKGGSPKKKDRALDRKGAGAYNRGGVLVKDNTDFGKEGKAENKFSTSSFVAFAAKAAAILLRKTTPDRKSVV